MTLLLCALMAMCSTTVAVQWSEPASYDSIPATPGLYELRCEVDTIVPSLYLCYGRREKKLLAKGVYDTTCAWVRHECEPVDSVLTVTPGYWEFEWTDSPERKVKR